MNSDIQIVLNITNPMGFDDQKFLMELIALSRASSMQIPTGMDESDRQEQKEEDHLFVGEFPHVPNQPFQFDLLASLIQEKERNICRNILNDYLLQIQYGVAQGQAKMGQQTSTVQSAQMPTTSQTSTGRDTIIQHTDHPTNTTLSMVPPEIAMANFIQNLAKQSVEGQAEELSNWGGLPNLGGDNNCQIPSLASPGLSQQEVIDQMNEYSIFCNEMLINGLRGESGNLATSTNLMSMQHTTNNHDMKEDDRRPHKCTDCNKSFRFKSNLFEHKSLHQNTKQPFMCPFCGKTCRLKGNLKKHLQIHVNSVEDLEQLWKARFSRSSGRPRKNAEPQPLPSFGDDLGIGPVPIKLPSFSKSPTNEYSAPLASMMPSLLQAQQQWAFMESLFGNNVGLNAEQKLDEEMHEDLNALAQSLYPILQQHNIQTLDEGSAHNSMDNLSEPVNWIK